MALDPDVTFSIKIDKRYGPQDRLAIAQDVIDFIVRRSQSGESVNHKKFAGYSSGYEKSLTGRIAGKKAGETADLTLSGDMLAALKLLEKRPGELVFGYKKSDPEYGRAKGNNLGTYGQDRPIPKKKREFIGITEDDLKKKILSKYPIDDKEALKERVLAVREASNFAKDITTLVDIEGDNE